MSDLGNQYRCPIGQRGSVVASMMNRHHRTLTLWGLTKVSIGSDFIVLDVGCGGGKTIDRLAKLSPQGKVFGIDCSIDMVKFTRKINRKLIAQKRVEIIEGSVEKMGFVDDFFDLVTAFETYYFWNNLPDAFEEIRRILKPGGKILLVNELLHGVTPTKVIEETHVRLLPLQEILNLLRSVGFVGVQLFTKVESPWNSVVAQK